MGIKDLSSFLREHGLGTDVSLAAEYRHMCIPCDIASTLFRYRTTSPDNDDFMRKVRNFVSSFLYNEVHAVFIFDGKAPPDKDAEQRSRAESRQKSIDRMDQLSQWLEDMTLTDRDLYSKVQQMGLRIEGPQSAEAETASRVANFLSVEPADDAVPKDEATPLFGNEGDYRQHLREVHEKREARNTKLSKEDMLMVQAFLTEYKVPWLQAPNEAEAFACYLIKKRPDIFADAILTEDSDSLTYGAGAWLSGYDNRTFVCRRVLLSEVLEALSFSSFSHLRDFCILCKCDYNQRLPGWGPTKLYKHWILPGLKLFAFLEKIGASEEAVAAVRLARCRVLFSNFGQDDKEMTEAVLGGCFAAWMAAREHKDAYWDLSREPELCDLTRRDRSIFQSGELENLRIRTNWRFPAALRATQEG